MDKTIFSKHGELVSQAIREIREQSGLTSRELSKKLGKGHSFISNCEVGERRVDLAEFFWICKTCNISPEKETAKLMRTFQENV